MKKQMISVIVLCAGLLSVQAQDKNGGISPEMLGQIRQSYQDTTSDKALRNAIGSNSIKSLTLNQEKQVGIDTDFSVKVESKGITDQQSSGRCWLFTGLNVMRAKAIARFGLPGLEFSQTYSFFWDQLEKSNLFLQGIIDTAEKPMNDQTVEWLFKHPLSDGGTFTGVADIVGKYGLVPKEAMPETYSSEHTSLMSSLIGLKLKEYGLSLREMVQKGASASDLEKAKTEMLGTVYRMLVLHDLTRFDFKYLKNCTAAGEALHTETSRLWREGTGIPIREGYGQTETVCMIATFKGETVKPGSMGKASPGWELELHDDEGNPVPDGENGRIALNLKNGRPVGLMDGYVNCEEENQKSFVNGYYYTGDKAWRDEDGYFWFVGRNDDIIKSSGYRISPQEVEEVIMQHPSVQEVAVVGAPDPLRGSRIKAYIVLKPEFDPTESLVRDIQRHTKELTAPYKYPREIEFVKSLPKSYAGKIKRDILRKHAETGGTLVATTGDR